MPGRALFVHADDLGEVIIREAVGAADAGERDELSAGTVLHPPGGAAEDGGDFLGEVEAREGGLGVRSRCGGRGYCGLVQGVSPLLADVWCGNTGLPVDR